MTTPSPTCARCGKPEQDWRHDSDPQGMLDPRDLHRFMPAPSLPEREGGTEQRYSKERFKAAWDANTNDPERKTYDADITDGLMLALAVGFNHDDAHVRFLDFYKPSGWLHIWRAIGAFLRREIGPLQRDASRWRAVEPVLREWLEAGKELGRYAYSESPLAAHERVGKAEASLTTAARAALTGDDVA